MQIQKRRKVNQWLFTSVIYLFMCLFAATLALLPVQLHQSPAALHLNDRHWDTAEATSCRQQPACYDLPPFIAKKTSVVAGE